MKSYEKKTLKVDKNHLCFTYCQVPVIYKIADTNNIEVVYNNSKTEQVSGLVLSDTVSTEIFNRTNKVSHLVVSIIK